MTADCLVVMPVMSLHLTLLSPHFVRPCALRRHSRWISINPNEADQERSRQSARHDSRVGMKAARFPRFGVLRHFSYSFSHLSRPDHICAERAKSGGAPYQMVLALLSPRRPCKGVLLPFRNSASKASGRQFRMCDTDRSKAVQLANACTMAGRKHWTRSNSVRII